MINAGMDLKKLPLDDIYELLTPTPKKVLKAVVASPKTPPETEAHTMLKRYIRECDSKTLKNFLRFCTGSDLLVCDMDNKNPKSIEISFNSLSGLQRRPVAHTCGRVKITQSSVRSSILCYHPKCGQWTLYKVVKG